MGEPPLGASSTWFYASEATFTAQLSVLHDEGWAALDLPTFIRSLRQPNARPDRSVLLTFDDGYRSTTEVAKNVLQKFGFPAVVFVPTDLIGKTNRFDREVEPEEAICDWSDLRALEDAGIRVESHGASHRRFSQLSARLKDVKNWFDRSASSKQSSGVASRRLRFPTVTVAQMENPPGASWPRLVIRWVFFTGADRLVGRPTISFSCRGLPSGRTRIYELNWARISRPSAGMTLRLDRSTSHVRLDNSVEK